MKTKVLLINPDPQIPANPPLGLLYVAAALEKAGTETRVLDLGFDRQQVDLVDTLNRWKPEVVGITCTTPLYPHARSVAERVKSILPDSWVIFGGVHPSVAPEYTLKNSRADIIVVGEGEQAMPQLARLFPDAESASKTPGVLVEISGKVLRAPPQSPIQYLDELPLPARHLVDVKRYFKASGHDRIKWSLPQPSLPVIASRGCPYRCAFCGSGLVHGRAVRLRSVPNIRRELENLVSTYGIRGVYFYDDTFTFNEGWLAEIGETLAGMRLKWICGTRLDRVNREILQLMRDTGCVLISYGIESGDAEMLNKVLHKGLTLSRIRENMRLTREIGIATVANYMLGFPGETEESMRKTIDLALEVDSDIAEFSIYMPLPGTELAARAEHSGKIIEDDVSRFDYARPTYSDDSLPPELVKKYHAMALRKFYLRPRYMLRRISRIRGWHDVKANLLGLKSFFSVWERSSGK